MTNELVGEGMTNVLTEEEEVEQEWEWWREEGWCPPAKTFQTLSSIFLKSCLIPF